MPSIRKYGEYKINHNIKKQLDELNNIIDKQQKEINVLKHNIKKPKFKKGGMVYILRIIYDDVSINTDETLYLKFGRTKNMDKRISTYETTTKNKVQIIKSIYVDDPKNIEHCTLKKMDNFRINNKKEYFECSYNQIIDAVSSCISFFENKDIDKKPDIEQINNAKRQTNFNINKDKNIHIKVLNDDEFNTLLDREKYNSDSESDSDTNDDSDEDLRYEKIYDEQSGGSHNQNLYFDYIKYKLKYLELKFDLL
jgi:hypothetical protein